MKKLLLVFVFIGILSLGYVCNLKAQQQDPLAIDDSVSIDNMNPAINKDQGNQQKKNTLTIIMIIAGTVTFYIRYSILPYNRIRK